MEADQAALLTEIQERDERDSQRSVAPLKPAADAIILDSTSLSIDEVQDKILEAFAALGLDD